MITAVLRVLLLPKGPVKSFACQTAESYTARKAKYSGPNSLEYGSAHAAYAAMF